MDIRIRDVQKYFGSFHALRGVSLDIASGELLALLGPSGSGKTTLLRAIAGLEPLDGGQILFGDTDGEGSRFASNARGKPERTAKDGGAEVGTLRPSRQAGQERKWIDATQIPVQQRQVGFVFQQYALFKHMTIAENIGFGLRVRKKKLRPDAAAIHKRVGELLELVQLGGLEKRYPSQLSGGQKQRVALARALAIEPRVLLLDEPFGALDAKVRKDLRRWLRQLHRETGYTTIFVTHDQEEALELADRVVVMSKGQIEQVGTTDEVYDRPTTPFVFDFLGTPNILEGEARGDEVRLLGAEAPFDTGTAYPQGPVRVFARPTDFRVVDSDPAALAGKVLETHRAGILLRLTIELRRNAQIIDIEIPNPDPEMKVWEPGDEIRIRPAHFSVFPRATQAETTAPPAAPVAEQIIEHSTAERLARAR